MFDVTRRLRVDVGADAIIKEGAVATLDSSGSYDPEGDTPLSFVWTQPSGPSVILSSSAVMPTFTAPLAVEFVMEFELVVRDSLCFRVS